MAKNYSATAVVEDEVPKIDESLSVETQEELQAELKKINAKLQKIEDEQEKEARVEIELPIANALVSLEKTTTIPMTNLTPPEVMLLVAMHHKGARGNPIKEITVTGKIKIDPLMLKERLVSKYGGERVNNVFPGTEPKFPVTFKRALSLGITTQLPHRNLLDFNIEPANSGE